jgi:hypothetical protein
MGNNFCKTDIDSENGSVVDYDPEENKLRKYHKNRNFLYKYFKCFSKTHIGKNKSYSKISDYYEYDNNNEDIYNNSFEIEI